MVAEDSWDRWLLKILHVGDAQVAWTFARAWKFELFNILFGMSREEKEVADTRRMRWDLLVMRAIMSRGCQCVARCSHLLLPATLCWPRLKEVA